MSLHITIPYQESTKTTRVFISIVSFRFNRLELTLTLFSPFSVLSKSPWLRVRPTEVSSRTSSRTCFAFADFVSLFFFFRHPSQHYQEPKE